MSQARCGDQNVLLRALTKGPTTGCPRWMGSISKLNYGEARNIWVHSKDPFLVIQAYIYFFQIFF